MIPNPIDPGFLVSATENTAAISAQIHASEEFRDFYNKNADTLQGFVGIWRLCGEAGIIFTEIEHELDEKWECGNWIDAVEAFGDRILLDNGPFDAAGLRVLARTIITEFRELNGDLNVDKQETREDDQSDQENEPTGPQAGAEAAAGAEADG